MDEFNVDASCKNCKFLEKLSPRVENYGYQCVVSAVRVGLMVGGGHTKLLTSSEDGVVISFPRLLISTPQYVSCSTFVVRPIEG